ncbi:hypothetical protein DB30_01569 [Enhygromyxa salina]|uniref:Uncharacterized protein n=1 Tax=Enhygromyxa salina TaxID=215803 RepID=A0A0C2CWW2_9BACT|nr:hypothetical protein [Enhygromyxa salina]KIG12337.1 hypothetical protein DB30_01569 [Enhygromyxa salina]
MQVARRREADELTGPVLEVLPKPLAEGRSEAVLAAVKASVVRNEQLERLIASLGRRSMKANEGVNSTQLRLLLDALSEQTDNCWATHLGSRRASSRTRCETSPSPTTRSPKLVA